jgi:hypothetical protein
MHALARGLFLLLLLAVDWAADPTLVAPAVEAQARRWASTENVCPSAGHAESVRRHAAPDPQAAPGPCDPAPAESSRPPHPPRPERASQPATPGGLVYVLRSIRR